MAANEDIPLQSLTATERTLFEKVLTLEKKLALHETTLSQLLGTTSFLVDVVSGQVPSLLFPSGRACSDSPSSSREKGTGASPCRCHVDTVPEAGPKPSNEGQR